MFLFDSALPFRLEPFPDESGMGYCLRAISKNGANFHAVRRLLGIRPAVQIARKHASALAMCTGVSAQWLREALIESSGAAKGFGKYGGHTFFSQNHLCTRCPQVCASCIHREGYCRDVWDIALSTVCTKHSCNLVNHCLKCTAALRWDRPSIDVSHCGHFISDDAMDLELDPRIFEWQSLLEELFSGHRPASCESAWKKLLSVMSLGGACTLISAFGIVEKPHVPTHPVQSVKNKSVAQWQGIIVRAIARIDGLQAGNVDPRALAPLIAQSILMRLLQTQPESVDSQICLNIFKRVFGVDVGSSVLGRFRGNDQMSLFDYEGH